jgi:hypothetical protein
MRWDLISIDFGTGTVSAGGVASAFANDGSEITLTGSGTFRSNPGTPQAVTGGGTWETSTGSGTYVVTGFVRYDVAPGTFPLPHDNIGNPADARTGLAVLKISYNDGSDGVLLVSCHFPGTPDAVFEGVTASKGFVDYWRPDVPVALVDANRTAFHVIH